MAPTRGKQKLFLDASCLIALLYLRHTANDVADYVELWEQCHISALTVHLLYHFGIRDGYGFDEIGSLVDHYKILPLNEAAVRRARRHYAGKDFEDCLQAACAELGKCDEIITLDSHFKKHSGTKLPVHVIR